MAPKNQNKKEDLLPEIESNCKNKYNGGLPWWRSG